MSTCYYGDTVQIRYVFVYIVSVYYLYQFEEAEKYIKQAKMFKS